MTPAQRELARHALGLPNDRQRSYRNRYFAAEGGGAAAQWLAMCATGEAERAEGDPRRFCLTLTGARAALAAGENLCPEDFPS